MKEGAGKLESTRKLPADAEIKSGRPKPTVSSTWPHRLRITKNVFRNILMVRGGPRRISVLYWTQGGNMTTEDK